MENSSLTFKPVRIGVIGLGRAFVLMLPTFLRDERVQLVAAFDPRPAARDRFKHDFGGRAYESAPDLCADPTVEAVYIASPHELHAEHAEFAALAGKHALVDKPISVSLADAQRMVDVFQQAGLQLIVGPSHSFDAPVQKAREIIDSGEVGRVRMVHALNCTDFLYRPRRPEELLTEAGGGVLFSQGVHQIDIVRLLCGGVAKAVTAMVGNWDPARPTEGAYSALIGFDDGTFASLTYSGYAHFDTDQWQDNVGELGYPKDQTSYGRARSALVDAVTAEQEIALKRARTFSAGSAAEPAPHHEHFGPIIVFCEQGDLHLRPAGVMIYGNLEKRFVTCPMQTPRAAVLDALYDAVRFGSSPVQTGAWGLASLEICHAILESAAQASPVQLRHQIGVAR